MFKTRPRFRSTAVSKRRNATQISTLKNKIYRKIHFVDPYSAQEISLLWAKVWPSETPKILIAEQERFDETSTKVSRRLFLQRPRVIGFKIAAQSFLNQYILFYHRTFYNVFRFTKQFDSYISGSSYKLFFNFRVNRLFVNLVSPFGRNYVSLSGGPLLKFFGNRKSLKKSKTFKLLIVKFLRKLLVISGISSVNLYFKGRISSVNEIVGTLLSPLASPFYDPLRGVTVAESTDTGFAMTVRYMIFDNIKSFTNMKSRSKGRLKRKIYRRVVKSNRITD